MKTPDINKILRGQPVRSERGAPMGSPSRLDDPEQPLYLQRVRMVDGDYAPDGTYWGGPPSEPLWCGFTIDGANRIYVRARTRTQAAAAILTDWDARIQNFTNPLES